MDNIAIVLGSKSVNATGLIRSLGMAGMKVTFMSTHTKIESKYTTNYIKLPNSKIGWLDTLVGYCKSFDEKPIVFPTDDDTAYFLDDNFEKLSEACYFSNAKGNMRTISDKTVMAELAKNSELNIAEFIKVDITNETENKIHFPIIIKPFAAFAGGKGDIKICNSRDEYNKAIEELVHDGYTEVMIQKFLRSDNQYEVGIMGMAMPSGEVVIPGVIHKIRSWPSDRGSTSYAQYQESDSAVDIEKIKEFVRKTNYIGLFDVELIISDNVAWFIEINYRNGQYGFLPTAAGYNLPYNLCLGFVENKIEPIKGIKPVYYINERDDYLHVKDGEISRKKWIQDFFHAKAYGMYCIEDQRPFLRQYIKIPDRVKIMLKKYKDRIKECVIKEEWNIAIRENNGNKLWMKNGTGINFTLLNNSFRYWAADPFIISFEDREYIFFEMYDRFKGKGKIGYREIVNGMVSKMKVAYEADTHLSFPFVFCMDGTFYMMPESSESKELFLLKAAHFPDNWEKIDTLMNGRRFVDSILFKYQDDVYLATQELESGYRFNNLKLFMKNGKEWISFKNNPVVESTKYARMAGSIIREKNNLIRVAQDCSEEYGKELHFLEICNLDDSDYIEKLIASVRVEDIKLDKNKSYNGIHTYNHDERYEVIDLKNRNHFSLGNVVNLFYLLLKKMLK